MSRVLGSVVAAALLLVSAPALADTVDSLLAKSQSAARAGHMDTAEHFAQAAIVADPTRASTYAALGDLYAHADQAEFASFYYGEALDIDPQNHAALAGLDHVKTAERSSSAAATPSLDKPSDAH